MSAPHYIRKEEYDALEITMYVVAGGMIVGLFGLLALYFVSWELVAIALVVRFLVQGPLLGACVQRSTIPGWAGRLAVLALSENIIALVLFVIQPYGLTWINLDAIAYLLALVPIGLIWLLTEQPTSDVARFAPSAPSVRMQAEIDEVRKSGLEPHLMQAEVAYIVEQYEVIQTNGR